MSSVCCCEIISLSVTYWGEEKQLTEGTALQVPALTDPAHTMPHLHPALLEYHKRSMHDVTQPLTPVVCFWHAHNNVAMDSKSWYYRTLASQYIHSNLPLNSSHNHN